MEKKGKYLIQMISRTHEKLECKKAHKNGLNWREYFTMKPVHEKVNYGKRIGRGRSHDSRVYVTGMDAEFYAGRVRSQDFVTNGKNRLNFSLIALYILPAIRYIR